MTNVYQCVYTGWVTTMIYLTFFFGCASARMVRNTQVINQTMITIRRPNGIQPSVDWYMSSFDSSS